MFFVHLELNHSWDVDEIVKYEGQQEEREVVIDGLIIETLHTFEDSTVHYP